MLSESSVPVFGEIDALEEPICLLEEIADTLWKCTAVLWKLNCQLEQRADALWKPNYTVEEPADALQRRIYSL